MNEITNSNSGWQSVLHDKVSINLQGSNGKDAKIKIKLPGVSDPDQFITFTANISDKTLDTAAKTELIKRAALEHYHRLKYTNQDEDKKILTEQSTTYSISNESASSNHTELDTRVTNAYKAKLESKNNLDPKNIGKIASREDKLKAIEANSYSYYKLNQLNQAAQKIAPTRETPQEKITAAPTPSPHSLNTANHTKTPIEGVKAEAVREANLKEIKETSNNSFVTITPDDPTVLIEVESMLSLETTLYSHSYKEQEKYTLNFLEHLIESQKKNSKHHNLLRIREDFKKQLKDLVDGSPIQKDLPLEQAKELWGNKESNRVLSTIEELCEDVKMQAAIASLDERNANSNQIDHIKELKALYREIGEKVLEDNKKDSELFKNGKVAIDQEYVVNSPLGKINISVSTNQYANEHKSSITKRNDPSKLINTLTQNTKIASDKALFKEATTLRSASFVFSDISQSPNTKGSAYFREEIKNIELELKETGPHKNEIELKKEKLAELIKKNLNIKNISDLKIAIEKEYIPEDTKKEFIKQITSEKESRDELIKDINTKSLDHEELEKVISQNPERAFAIIDSIQNPKAKEMLQNLNIIKANTQAFERLIDDIYPEKTDSEQIKIGAKLPESIDKILEDIKSRGEYKGKCLASISLQTPMNVDKDHGVLNQLAHKAQIFKPILPEKLANRLEQLISKDLNELPSIDQERQGFHKACENKGVKGLYFNLATNAAGQKRAIGSLGPLNFKFRLANLFNNAPEDKKKAAELKRTTEESAKFLRDMALEVQYEAEKKIKKLEEALKKENSNTDRKSIDELKRYVATLDSLEGKLFKKSKDGTIKLADAPGSNAQYDTIGGLNVLMQILGIPTNIHCRSGNNRTAIALAKSEQYFVAASLDPEGKTPEFRDTAGSLAGSEEEHWSYPVFMKNLEQSFNLQLFNRGAKGIKAFSATMENKFLAKAIFGGGVPISGAFDEKIYNKVLKDLKLQK